MNKLLTTFTLLVAMATGARAQLLGSPEVRRELGLSHQTSVLILRDLNESARLNQGGAMSSDKYHALQAERKNAPSPEALSRRAMNRLTPTQKKRLEQIGLQMGDPLVLQDWRVSQRIGLNKAQYDKLNRDVNRAFRQRVKAQQALSKRDQSWWGQADRKKYSARYAAHDREFNSIENRYAKTVRDAVNRILTSQQKAKWSQIKGKPFKAKLTSNLKIYPMD